MKIKKHIMKQLLFFMFLLSAALLNKTAAQDSTIYTKDGVALEVRATGNNTLVELNHPDSVFNFSVAVAKFPPGKKLDWHYHPGGQILIITEGIGYYQERGKTKRVVRKGEVIKCLPGV